MNKAITFVKEAWLELKQVAWLTTPQMIASTWIVIILSIFLAFYILGVDKIWQIVISILV
ncbi:preprotein translocase subunit SecE [bacterium F11]|nr:preprotein translocase subunit SecE [bacterium F11]